MELEGQFRRCLSKAILMIIIAPFAKSLINNKRNPKNYPYWDKLIKLTHEKIVQVGVEGEEQLVYDFKKD